MFIAFDGIDGAGKSTQIQQLCRWFEGQGREVALFREPGSTALGEAVREILLHREDIELNPNSEMLLYMASRAQLVAEKIRPALQSGKIVVCDRFLLASVVYQGVAGGLSVEDLWAIGKVATGGLRPDCTILLDLPVEVAQSRLSDSPDRFEKRGPAYFEKVRRGFLEQVSNASSNFLIVDATHDIGSMHQSIVAKITGSEELRSSL